ncbi:iron complex transport system ATP-binding protein [Mumia flava]|uniref:Iron complex transport system ATP-binding protein n=1 Tax=Mumia flava TaxID=1348852 RepID=A0A0B2BHP0_9ACTN|nr:heme ABC transporter ATP-binding protein [Mumia flava]PJJ58491.1 iron complex transport system ATP-binding protein [Mumia flava]
MSASAHRPPLQVLGAQVSYDGVTVVDEVDLDVRAGEMLALVGPNGAGKSTLLGVLAGDVDLTAGRVLLDGEPITLRRSGELSRRRSVLLQEHRLSFPFTVVEVVAMGRAPWYGRDEEDADEAVVADAMRRTDVEHLARRRFPTLSGGEKARTSFARTIAQETPIVLLDEPTAALDIAHQEALLSEARRLADTGHAVVAVLHDLSLAAAYADRVCVLADGRVRADGPPADVLRADLIEDVYGYPVDVFVHPRTGDLLVTPLRPHRLEVPR